MKQNSKRLTSIVIAALFLVVALVVYLEFIVPAYADLQEQKGQAMSEQALYENEKQVVGQVQALITTYQGEASSTQSVNMALPVGQNVADALAQVYGIATNTGFNLTGTGIAIQTIQPVASQPVVTASTSIGSVSATGGSIVRPAGTVTFSVTGSGSYEALNAFLQGLENNIRIFDVTGISIQPASIIGAKGPVNQDLFNYTITVVTYYQSS